MQEKVQLENDLLKLVLQSNLTAGDAIAALGKVQHQIECFALDIRVGSFVGLNLDCYGRVKHDLMQQKDAQAV